MCIAYFDLFTQFAALFQVGERLLDKTKTLFEALPKAWRPVPVKSELRRCCPRRINVDPSRWRFENSPVSANMEDQVLYKS